MNREWINPYLDVVMIDFEMSTIVNWEHGYNVVSDDLADDLYPLPSTALEMAEGFLYAAVGLRPGWMEFDCDTVVISRIRGDRRYDSVREIREEWREREFFE